MLYLKYALLIVFVYTAWVKCDEIVVTTPLGKIEGSLLTSRLENNIYAFRSIRYAKPPVDNLRFQPPVPVEKWDGIYDATKPGPVCPQPRNINVSEDCLMLNVYINKLPLRNDNLDRPVLVFFHPGGFYGFNGASYTFGPQYLLDEDIVLVTANYRLGSLGFLSTGTKEAPGNNGFKDQVLVLKWVQNNIRSFGGNPDMVTLAGYSAGAVSTTLHMVSPMSKGLFHRAIVMSSSALAHKTISTSQIDLAKKQARFLNCSDDTPTNILSCLKTKSAQDIADTLPLFAEVGGDPILRWMAVIEPDFGQERFLVEHPVTSILHGRFEKVPTMAGITLHEFGYVSYRTIRNQTRLGLLQNDYKRILPIIFSYERNTENSNKISTALKGYYLGDGPVDNSSRLGIHHLYADGVTGFPVDRTVKLLSEKSTENTYYYHFTYKGRYSFFYELDSNNTETIGPVHHDDLMYLFYMSRLFPFVDKTSPEWNTVNRMVKMWTDFVKFGNPIPHKTDLLNNIDWMPYKRDNRKYLDIGDELVLKENLHEDRYRVWEQAFPLKNYL